LSGVSSGGRKELPPIGGRKQLPPLGSQPAGGPSAPLDKENKQLVDLTGEPDVVTSAEPPSEPPPPKPPTDPASPEAPSPSPPIAPAPALPDGKGVQIPSAPLASPDGPRRPSPRDLDNSVHAVVETMPEAMAPGQAPVELSELPAAIPEVAPETLAEVTSEAAFEMPVADEIDSVSAAVLAGADGTSSAGNSPAKIAASPEKLKPEVSPPIEEPSVEPGAEPSTESTAGPTAEPTAEPVDVSVSAAATNPAVETPVPPVSEVTPAASTVLPLSVSSPEPGVTKEVLPDTAPLQTLLANSTPDSEDALETQSPPKTELPAEPHGSDHDSERDTDEEEETTIPCTSSAQPGQSPPGTIDGSPAKGEGPSVANIGSMVVEAPSILLAAAFVPPSTAQAPRSNVWHEWLVDRGGSEQGSLPEFTAESGQIVRIFCGTWNLHGKSPPADISDWVSTKIRHHIYVVGTCECERSIGKSLVWANKARWETQMTNHLGEDYQMVGAQNMSAIHIMVFVHKSLWKYCCDVSTGQVATGFANLVGNKGCTMVGFKLGHTSLLFMNSHLAAHATKMKERTQNLQRILTDAPIRKAKLSAGVHEEYNHVFFIGDLNARINGSRSEVDDLISVKDLSNLLARDQLCPLLRGEVSEGKHASPLGFWPSFKEAQIDFMPTYKFDKGTDIYDSSKKHRVPSWTDRILWKDDPEVRSLSYSSVDLLKSSDHRPVFAQFEVTVDLANWEGPEMPDTRRSRLCSVQ